MVLNNLDKSIMDTLINIINYDYDSILFIFLYTSCRSLHTDDQFMFEYVQSYSERTSQFGICHVKQVVS